MIAGLGVHWISVVQRCVSKPKLRTRGRFRPASQWRSQDEVDDRFRRPRASAWGAKRPFRKGRCPAGREPATLLEIGGDNLAPKLCGPFQSGVARESKDRCGPALVSRSLRSQARLCGPSSAVPRGIDDARRASAVREAGILLASRVAAGGREHPRSYVRRGTTSRAPPWHLASPCPAHGLFA
jgi:hypothetical protein